MKKTGRGKKNNNTAPISRSLHFPIVCARSLSQSSGMSSPSLWSIKLSQCHSSQDDLRGNGGLTSVQRRREASVLLPCLPQHGPLSKTPRSSKAEQARISEAPGEGVDYSRLRDRSLSESSTVIRITPAIRMTLIAAVVSDTLLWKVHTWHSQLKSVIYCQVYLSYTSVSYHSECRRTWT